MTVHAPRPLMGKGLSPTALFAIDGNLPVLGLDSATDLFTQFNSPQRNSGKPLPETLNGVGGAGWATVDLGNDYHRRYFLNIPRQRRLIAGVLVLPLKDEAVERITRQELFPVSRLPRFQGSAEII